MLRRLTDFMAKMIFGKEFENGYVEEPKEKDKYVLSSIFPSERMMQEAIGGYKEK